MRNDIYLKTGTIFFGVSILALGIMHVATSNFAEGLLPVPATLPGRTFLAYLSGIVMIIAGILILIRKYTWSGAFLAAFIFLVFLLFLHIPKLVMHLNVSGEWTPAIEVLMLFSGALILGGVALTDGTHQSRTNKLLIAGKYIFALSLFGFAVLHFLFMDFVVGFISAWIPWHVFWAWLVTGAFLAASVSLFIQKQVRLSSTLLGLMFFIWVCILHLPELIANIHVAQQWTFLFVPLAMSGIGLLIAGSARQEVRQQEPRSKREESRDKEARDKNQETK